MNLCDVDIETLEAYEAGALPQPRLAELNEHLAGCEACRVELDMLRGEQRLMALRAASLPATDHLWMGVEERLRRKPLRRAPSGTLPLAISTALAAAAVLAMLVWGGRPGLPGPRPSASLFPATPAIGHDAPTAQAILAMDQAEREYAAAAAELERRFKEQRKHFDPDAMARLDNMVGNRPSPNAVDRDNVEARQVALSGQADYVHSLQRLVVDVNDVHDVGNAHDVKNAHDVRNVQDKCDKEVRR